MAGILEGTISLQDTEQGLDTETIDQRIEDLDHPSMEESAQELTVKQHLKELGKKNVFIRHVYRQVYQENRNFIFLTIGKPGTGKSFATLRILELLDPSFNAQRITFDARGFLNLVNSNFPPGSAIMFDEAGTDVSRRRWYSDQNLIVSGILQTFRIRRYILGITVPDPKMIDSHILDLADAQIETQGVDHTTGRSHIKIKILQKSYNTNQIYTHFLKNYEKDKLYEVPRFVVTKPTKDLVRSYMYQKISFTDRYLGQQSVEQLKRANVDTHIQPDLTEIEREVHARMLAGWNRRAIAEELKMGLNKINAVAAEIEYKGYSTKRAHRTKDQMYGFKKYAMDVGPTKVL